LNVKFVDLLAQHEPLETQLMETFSRVIRTGSFVLGPEVEKFESQFAAYCGVAHCGGVANGTAALQLVLHGLGVSRGDEVITVAHTFIATAEAISASGARPVLVDIDSASYTIDSSKLEAAITPRTKAIIPVHLYGQTADMDNLNAIAGKYGIPIVEDSCQAHGATYKGRRAGSLGVAGCFSFYPSKNLGACGEGGAVTTNDPQLAHAIRMLRDHGSVKKYHHEFPAYNLRLEGIQGGVLSVKLPHLDRWNRNRRVLAGCYDALFAGSKVITPKEMPWAGHVYHLYVVLVEDREAVRTILQQQGIETGLHYPVPLHLQKAYENLGYRKGDFPVSEYVAAHLLSLPMYADLPMKHVEYVAKIVREVLECQVVSSTS
jgi:dTDP-4-amino-4,6-dideoxygalactose transaminase